MKNTASKALVPVGVDKPGILTASPDALRHSLGVNLGPGGLNPFDLTRIRVPTGGGLEWISETFAGERREKEITGIITVVRDVRSYWKVAYGTGETTPPDCQSPNGIQGYGDPGIECHRCPNNVFGSKGRGKACSEMKQLFIHRGESMLPEVIQLPPTSVGICKKYLLWLAGQQAPYYSVYTSLTLAPVKNTSGITYSEARFRMTGELSQEETDIMARFHTEFKAYVDQMPVTTGYNDAEA